MGHADVAAHMAFHACANYFHTGELDRSWWKDVRTLTQVTAPFFAAERVFLVVEGDVAADVTLAEGGAVVVYGDVRATIETAGQSEVVIGGDLREDGAVSGDGIFHMFVGGDSAGCLRSRGSCKAWVEGCLRGPVYTGQPSTELRLRGDCTTTIRPSEKPALFFLEVGRFMPYAALEATAAVGYTVFNASVARSDRPPGMYPQGAARTALREHRSYNRWVVRDTVRPPKC